MLKKNPVSSGQTDLFRERLESIIDMRHRLVTLSRIIKWDWLESCVSKHYCHTNGRPGGSIRMMMGLLILKDIEGQSDESVCERWIPTSALFHLVPPYIPCKQLKIFYDLSVVPSCIFVIDILFSWRYKLSPCIYAPKPHPTAPANRYKLSMAVGMRAVK